MPDLDVLRQRVEDAERRLTTVQSSRENECQSLMDMWLRIRDRFQDQEQEISAYRSRLAALQDANVELTELIGSMLQKVESSVSQHVEETVPTIAEMAKNLLESEPGQPEEANGISAASQETKESETPLGAQSLVDTSHGAISLGDIVDSEIVNLEPAPEPPFPRLLVNAGSGVLDLPEKMRPQTGEAHMPANGETIQGHYEGEPMIEDVSEDIPDPEPLADPESQGLRSLLSRIDSAVRRPIAAGEPDDLSDAEEIGREIEEIELLRKELSGLRQRITTATAAE